MWRSCRGSFALSSVVGISSLNPETSIAIRITSRAKRAAFCFLELMKRLERSRQRLGILALVWGAEVFPADVPFLSGLAVG